MAPRREVRFRGVAISPGVAIGRACHLYAEAPEPTDALPEGPEWESARLQRALLHLGEWIADLERKAVARLGTDEVDIIRGFYRGVLADGKLKARMLQSIQRRGLSAVAAVRSEIGSVAARLRASPSAYLRERAADVTEIERRLVEALEDRQPYVQCSDEMRCRLGECRAGREHVVIAADMVPTAILELDSCETIGFVSEHGGVASHAAIVARSLGLPAVSGIPGIHRRIPEGATLVIDGDRGEVLVHPDRETLERLEARRESMPPARGPVPAVPGFCVLANINRAEDVASALDLGAEGIGLYRTEMELLAAGRLLDEEEQYRKYAHVIEAMRDRPVCIRMLDLGADKSMPFLNLERESNPQLGVRGARLLLGRPDLFQPQARALARASHAGPVRVLYPMVTSLNDFLRLKASFEKAIPDLEVGAIEHGVLFEVPAACLEAAEILAVADFGCIGTNDLIQYLFAMDRGNKNLASDCAIEGPTLWRLIETIAGAAATSGKDLSICGELAGDPANVPRVLEAGVQTVSVTPRRIADVRRAAARVLHSN